MRHFSDALFEDIALETTTLNKANKLNYKIYYKESELFE